MKDLGERIINAPNAIIGACVGAGIEGMCPIGEMQFNDFVASGFNQLVNNASMLHYRLLSLPDGDAMPGVESDVPDLTIPKIRALGSHRTPGLKTVVPSTPHDVGPMRSAALIPARYSTKHIALYRDPKSNGPLRRVRDVPIGSEL